MKTKPESESRISISYFQKQSSQTLKSENIYSSSYTYNLIPFHFLSFRQNFLVISPLYQNIADTRQTHSLTYSSSHPTLLALFPPSSSTSFSPRRQEGKQPHPPGNRRKTTTPSITVPSEGHRAITYEPLLPLCFTLASFYSCSISNQEPQETIQASSRHCNLPASRKSAGKPSHKSSPHY